MKHPITQRLAVLACMVACSVTSLAHAAGFDAVSWRIYVEEFAQAMTMAGAVTALPEVECLAPNGDFMTPFERKYHDSGQSLWRMRAILSWQPDLMPMNEVINKV